MKLGRFICVAGTYNIPQAPELLCNNINHIYHGLRSSDQETLTSYPDLGYVQNLSRRILKTFSRRDNASGKQPKRLSCSMQGA